MLRAGVLAGVVLLIGMAFAACGGDDDAASASNASDGGDDRSVIADSTIAADGGTDGSAGDAADANYVPAVLRWASTYATRASGGDVAFAGDSVIVTVPFLDVVDFDGKTVDSDDGGVFPGDFVVAKLDAAGKATWVTQLGGDGLDYATRVSVDAAGDVYFTGESQSSKLRIGTTDLLARPGSGSHWSFVVKLNGATGEAIWAQPFGGANSTTCTALDVAGSHVAVGCTFLSPSTTYVDGTGSATTIAGYGPESAFVAHLSADTGRAMWADVLGTSGALSLTYGVSVFPNGDVVATGTFDGVTLDDSAASNKPVTRKGSAANAFLTRHAAADGKMMWATGYGDVGSGDATVHAVSIALAPTGGLVLVGGYTGAAGFGAASAPPVGSVDGDAFLVGVDQTDGSTRWQKTLNGANQESAGDVAIDIFGNMIAIGAYRSTGLTVDGVPLPANDAGTSGWIAKWAPDGGIVWAKPIAAQGIVAPGGVTTHATNADIAFGGGFTGSIDFGSGKKDAGSDDVMAFVVRVGP